MSYFGRLSEWIKKAQSLKFNWKTISHNVVPDSGGRIFTKERQIFGKRGTYTAGNVVERHSRNSIGIPRHRTYMSNPQIGRFAVGGSRINAAKFGRRMYREAGFSKKSLIFLERGGLSD